MKFLKALLKWTGLVILLLVIVVVGFVALWPDFGGSMEGDRLTRAQAFSNFREGRFFNDVPQAEWTVEEMKTNIKEAFAEGDNRSPPATLPLNTLTPADFSEKPANALRAIWFGHASVMLEVDGVRLMTDPVFSDRVSPISFAGPLRSHQTPIALMDLPKVDVVVISHDHYDHMDMKTTQYLAKTGTVFFVPLGAGAHLEAWGIPLDQFTEMQWWQEAEFKQLRIISTPARHYSGRFLHDQKATLWTSWSIIGKHERAFYSGDTGYSPHFKAIGEKFGPFDLNIMKIGAYGPGQSWIDIHMTPEDAVQAHQDLNANAMLPVHWATFNLAYHRWDEPIERAVAASRLAGVKLVTPRIGDPFEVKTSFESTSWWESVK